MSLVPSALRSGDEPALLHTVMKLSNNGDDFFEAAVFYHDSIKAVSADHVKCLSQINISRIEVSVLFRTLLLQQTPSQQFHVHNGTRIDSPVRVPVWDGCWGDSEGLWLGSCSKLKVRRFHGDYHMPVSSLTVCKYGWWRCLESCSSCSFTHISWMRVRSLPISADPPSL